jgi:hypothetical protein
MNVTGTLRRIGLILLLAGAVSTAGAAPLLGGFVEGTQAVRVQRNPALGDGDFGERSYPRSELRAQFTLRDDLDRASFFVRADLLSDAVADERNEVDLREAYIKLYLVRWMDVKAGRQVATWGTGDLIFANDLFAKDWRAFFTGLDDSYLKALVLRGRADSRAGRRALLHTRRAAAGPAPVGLQPAARSHRGRGDGAGPARATARRHRR